MFRNLVRFVSITLTIMYASCASAYIFGPPNVTELAESGSDSDNFSLFTRTETDVFSGSNADVKSNGIAGVFKKGDQSGSTTFMYRFAQTNLNTSTLNRDGMDFGFGLGGEWNVLSDRSLNLLANLQYDAGFWDYTKGSTNSGTLLTLGVEAGAIYRIFIDTATIAPFVMYNKFITNNNITPTSGSTWTLTNDGTSVNYGMAFIIGNFTLTYTSTSSDSTLSSSVSSVTTSKSTKGTMITIGVNF